MNFKAIYTVNGETLVIENQWAAQAESRDTTVSSSAWEYSGAGTLSGASLSGTLATVKLAATSCGTLKNTATLASGEVLIGKRRVRVG